MKKYTLRGAINDEIGAVPMYKALLKKEKTKSGKRTIRSILRDERRHKIMLNRIVKKR